MGLLKGAMFGALLAAATQFAAADQTLWHLDPLGWEDGGEALLSRSSGFALANAQPSRSLDFTARVVARSCDGDSFGSAGIGAFSQGDYWCLSMVRGPLHSGARRFCELIAVSGGRWPLTGRFRRVDERKGQPWEFGRSYDFRIRIRPDGIEGEIRDAEDGSLVYQASFAADGIPVLAAGALPALRCTGRFKAAVKPGAPFALHGVANKPPPGASVPLFPPYSPVGSETGIGGTATGFFHCENISGVDWVVDPAGRAIPFLGVDHVRSAGFTSEKLGYSPYGRFVETNYPSTTAWADETLGRLRAWGFNVLAARCELPLLERRGLAHTIGLDISDRFSTGDDEWRITENLHAPGTGFPNVFHPEWERACEWSAEMLCAPNRDDPWLVGYFIDNEIAWGGRGHGGATGLFDAVAAKPDTHPAKMALRAFLAGREPTAKLKMEFLRLVADKYFAATTSAIRKADPNHMILGCRFAGTRKGAHDVVWQVAGEYCDIVSFNCYPWADLDRGVVLLDKGGAPVAEEFRRIHSLCRKPMLVTEWSFPALDAGRPCHHGGGQRFHTQSERATASELFARAILSEPYFVGYDWFMWLDQPATGISRWFPEDCNYGLVGENGEPYGLLTGMFSRLHSDVAAVRASRPCAGSEAAKTAWRGESGAGTSERERFFAEAAAAASEKPDSTAAGDVVFARDDGGGWVLSNGLVSVSGRLGGAFMADSLSFGGLNAPAGRFRALIQRSDDGRTLWTDTGHVTEGSFSRDVQTGTISAEIRAVGGADDNSMSSVSAGLAAMAFSKVNPPAVFAVTARLSLAPGRPEVLAEIVSVENLSAEPLRVEQVFMRPYAAQSRPREAGSVPKLWKGPLEGWWILPDGRRFGLASRDDSVARVRFWIKDDGIQHPDASFTDGAPFTLAPGEKWTPSMPMGALLKCKSGIMK